MKKLDVALVLVSLALVGCTTKAEAPAEERVDASREALTLATADNGQTPQHYILMVDVDGKLGFCGGTAISQFTVATSAHCARTMKNEPIYATGVRVLDYARVRAALDANPPVNIDWPTEFSRANSPYFRATSKAIFVLLSNTNPPSDDFGLVVFTQSLDLPAAPIWCKGPKKGDEAAMQGHMGDLVNKFAKSTITSVSDAIELDYDSKKPHLEEGDSGSGLWVKRGETYGIVGTASRNNQQAALSIFSSTNEYSNPYLPRLQKNLKTIFDGARGQDRGVPVFPCPATSTSDKAEVALGPSPSDSLPGLPSTGVVVAVNSDTGATTTTWPVSSCELCMTASATCSTDGTQPTCTTITFDSDAPDSSPTTDGGTLYEPPTASCADVVCPSGPCMQATCTMVGSEPYCDATLLADGTACFDGATYGTCLAGACMRQASCADVTCPSGPCAIGTCSFVGNEPYCDVTFVADGTACFDGAAYVSCQAGACAATSEPLPLVPALTPSDVAPAPIGAVDTTTALVH